MLAILVFLGFTKDIPFTQGHRVKAVFESANSLRPGSPVRIAGVEVGKVKAVDGQEGSDNAVVTMEIEESGLPLHTDATAKIRPRIFLEGNFFVDLRPGTPGAPELDDGDTIKVTQTATPVQLDEVLTSLQSDTRADLQDVLRVIGTAWTAEPTAAQNRDADPSARGQSAAESFNDAYDDIGPAERAQSQVNEALLGTEPERDLQRLVSGAARTSAGLARNETQLKDLVSNFNTTMAALAAEDASLRAAVAILPSTLATANAAFSALNAAFPPTRAFAIEILPGVNETAATIDAAFPWIRAMRALLAPAELQGLAADLAPAARDLARLTNTSLDLLPQTNLLSRCATDVLLPTGDVVIRDEFSTGRENYKELLYSMVGLAGEGQNFDGNGMYVRFQTGGGHEPGVGRPLQPRQPAAVRGAADPADRQPARVPGPALALQARRALLPPAAAGPQRAGGGAHPARRHGGHRGHRRARAGPGAAAADARARGRAAVRAIRKHARDFAAVIALIVVAFLVASVILANQRLALPGWVPFLGESFVEVEAELSSAQAVTPGQGQTVNVAGVEVGEISAVRLEGGKAIVTLQAARGRPCRSTADASVLLRPKTGLKDMVAELTPGTRGGRRARRGRSGSRSARRCPTSTSTRSSPASTATPAPTCSCCSPAARRGSTATPSRSRDTIRRFEPLARDSLAVAGLLAKRQRNIKRVDPQLLAARGGAGRQGRPARRVRGELQRGLRRARRAGREPVRHRRGAARHAARDADRAGRDGRAGRRARPCAGGAAPGRPRAGAGAARDAPVPGRDDADHPGRDPPVRACRPAQRERAAPGAERPGRRRARPACARSGSSTRSSTRWPTTRPASARRATCSGPRGSTTSGRRCSGARTPTARSAAAPCSISCQSLALLDNVIVQNPQLGVLTRLLALPPRTQVCPAQAQPVAAG